jgi:hypothetical protein
VTDISQDATRTNTIELCGLKPMGADGAGDRVALVPRRRGRSLVMWSGGLDSTYALARLLEQTDDEVYAHHIHLNAPRDDGKARSRRCEFEAQAVPRLSSLLKSRYRGFDYSESRADLTAFPSFARDTVTAMYFAAQLAMSRRFTPLERIVLGVNDQDPRWRSGSELYAFRRAVLNRILRGVWESEDVPYLYLFDPRPSKAEETAYLGEEISALTVSCRHPQTDGVGFTDDGLHPCGDCRKCRDRSAITSADAADAAGAEAVA